MQMSRRIRSAAAAAAALLLATTVTPLGQADAQSIPGVVSGVDVAGHQRPGGAAIDWRSVGTIGGQDFAFVKASEGEGWKNEFYDEDAKAAADAGLKVGAYHYARPAEDPVTQARYFASVINQGPATQLPPVLDLEVDEGLGPVQLAAWTQRFLSEVQAQTGKKPMIYTYRYFWYEHMNDTSAFTSYPLWLAAYQNQPPAPVGGWDKLSFWQRSDSGRVVGINTPVDMNLFNGTSGQLNQFAAGNLNAAGGVLERFQAPDSGELKVLEQDSTKLVIAVLALAAGGLGVQQFIDAARLAGFDLTDANNIARLVQQLAGQGELPIDDLRTMMVGNYQIGDLLILLDNALKH
ncbi:Lyzozyme M1 (1,4-beta-N-acetylmuramidase), GH25 family [Corynebacterium coyleae]|uniref:Glycoside hydrolase family 25 protein n=1 Tax=Corynebacterium coyleae TaxID=53374 RepID=A0ABX8KTQ3_9CORY|nr:glycoside hydrolase family 25 protein [Corynebacterium coyleae]QXB18230.1 glycoside hydrolase family 25 protein [Corynebacterium coyleae]WJY79707.1 Lysozyme M1 precursor [Corynebacterium coyleae]SEB90053.1 Lyzozyme M1 (1,4-beta-N-acetylmuramidase), GH25 family [Corynebacterium coyleae]